MRLKTRAYGILLQCALFLSHPHGHTHFQYYLLNLANHALFMIVLVHKPVN